MSVGSDNFGSSDLTSYYCLNCDSRHELELDASPFVCDIKYSSDEELGNIVPLNTMQAAHQQTCVIINAPTGAEIHPTSMAQMPHKRGRSMVAPMGGRVR
jgi:hypothetical protein